MNTERKVIPTTEIVGALMTYQLGDDARKQLKDDPQSYILSKSNVDVTTKIAIVENSADSVALALPYYESLDSVTMEGVADDDLDEVSGGEIFISIGIALGAVIGTAVAVTATSTFAAGVTAIGVGVGVGAAVGATAAAAVAGATVGAVHATGNLPAQK